MAVIGGVRVFRSIMAWAVGVAALAICSPLWAEMKSVRANKVNFRQAPAAEADVLYTAERYYPVQVLERKRGWAKTRDFEGEIGWIAERLLGNDKTVVVIAQGVVAREAPDAQSKGVFDAQWSDGFVVERTVDGWVQVQGSKGQQGWIPTVYLWGMVPGEDVGRDRMKSK